MLARLTASSKEADDANPRSRPRGTIRAALFGSCVLFTWYRLSRRRRYPDARTQRRNSSRPGNRYGADPHTPGYLFEDVGRANSLYVKYHYSFRESLCTAVAPIDR